MEVPTIKESAPHEGRCPPGRPATAGRLMLLAITTSFCASLALWAQTSTSQIDDANKSGSSTSWTATTESHKDNAESLRTTESHTQSGNRTLDKQSIQRLGSDGSFEPYQDVEKETVHVDDATVRTVTRTYGRDADGTKILVEVTEEEKHSVAGGGSNVVRSTSHPDTNGDLQLVRRQIEETTKTSPNVEVTKTTVMLPSVNGGLVPGAKVQERREQGADGTVESQKTTLLPDGAGNWQVNEIRQTTTRQAGDSRSTDEQVSVPDSEGKLGEVSRTVSNEEATTSGEKRDTVDTYSSDIPGAVGDGRLHLVERATTTQQTSSNGQQVTEQQVEQANSGDPGSGLRVTTVTIDTVRPGASGAQATRTVQARDANGSFGVVSVDTAKSDNIHAIQVQIAPSAPPKPPSK
jgi:hypothetical protein